MWSICRGKGLRSAFYQICSLEGKGSRRASVLRWQTSEGSMELIEISEGKLSCSIISSLQTLTFIGSFLGFL